MSRRTLVLGMVAVFLAGLLVALAPGNVAAAGTDSMWFPVEGWSTYDSCAGEWIDWSGGLHYTVRVTAEGNCRTFHTHYNNGRFRGVGRDSGTKYNDTSASQYENTYCGNWWGNEGWTAVDHDRRHITRQGSGLDYAMRLDVYQQYAPPPDNIWISEIKNVEFFADCD